MNLASSLKDITPIAEKIKRCRRPVKLGFTGVPPDSILREAVQLSDEVIDLDMPLAHIPVSASEPVVPKICCATLRTIVANSLSIPDLDWIILSSGADKCDGGRFIGQTLQKMLSIPVILTENLNMKHAGNPVCESGLPLREKFQTIVDGIINPVSAPMGYAQPEFGFWGVPPNDFSVLDLFPSSTHVFGWARCIENRTPADLELEEYVNPDLPTVFFAQAFCPKNLLAYRLAKKYNGLYVEVDSRLDKSVKAKIEAFLWLSKNRNV